MIRVGVIGAGGVGAAHVAALRNIPDVAVMAVAGSTAASAASTANALGVPHSFVGSADLIASGAVDSVHICTPNDLHLEAARAAFQADIHVVCEKPLATNTNDALAIAELATKSSAASTVCYHYRYSPLIADLMALVEQRQLGRIHSIRASYLQNWQLDSAPSWRNDPVRSGGSRVLADIGTHLLDLVEVTTLDTVASIEAEFLSLRGMLRPGSDDAAVALARLSRGSLASLSVSQVSPGHMNSISLELDGDAGSARWELNDRESLVFIGAGDASSVRLDGHANPKTAGRTWHSRLDADARLSNLFGAFYGQILGSAPASRVALPTVADAARHVALVDEASLGLALAP